MSSHPKSQVTIQSIRQSRHFYLTRGFPLFSSPLAPIAPPLAPLVPPTTKTTKTTTTGSTGIPAKVTAAGVDDRGVQGAGSLLGSSGLVDPNVTSTSTSISNATTTTTPKPTTTSTPPSSSTPSSTPTPPSSLPYPPHKLKLIQSNCVLIIGPLQFAGVGIWECRWDVGGVRLGEAGVGSKTNTTSSPNTNTTPKSNLNSNTTSTSNSNSKSNPNLNSGSARVEVDVVAGSSSGSGMNGRVGVEVGGKVGDGTATSSVNEEDGQVKVSHSEGEITPCFRTDFTRTRKQ